LRFELERPGIREDTEVAQHRLEIMTLYGSRLHHHFGEAMKALRLQAFWMLAVLSFAGANPFVGTWKLDAKRSKFIRGDPSFMFATMQIESTANGLKSSASAATGEGLATDFTFSCTLDGTPCKVTTALPMRGSTALDMISLKRIDDHTIAATGMRNGKLVYKDQRVVSADGDTMTVTREGTTPEGRKYQSTIVLVRSG